MFYSKCVRESLVTSEDAEEMFDQVLNSAAVTALMGQVLQRFHWFLHQLGIICLQLTWNTHTHTSIHIHKIPETHKSQLKSRQELTSDALPDVQRVLTEVKSQRRQHGGDSWRHIRHTEWDFKMSQRLWEYLRQRETDCVWSSQGCAVELSVGWAADVL